MFAKYNKINSLGNGNCAINAFSLAFIDHVFANLMDKQINQNYNQFIEALSLEKETKEEDNWSTFKKFIVKNKNRTDYLQNYLAPALRNIAVSAKKNSSPQDGIKDSEIETFKVEFREFIYRILSLPLGEKFQGGDIFKRVPAIQTKYNDAATTIINNLLTFESEYLQILMQIAIENNLGEKDIELLMSETSRKTEKLEAEIEKQQESLEAWFISEGYKEFVKHTESSGTWVGHMELCEIGNYFDIDIKVYFSNNDVHALNNHYGLIPFEVLSTKFQKSHLDLLKNRGIVDISPEGIVLREITEDELIKRLEAIENSKELENYWLEKHNFTEKLSPPENFPKDQLIKREIITKEGFFYSDLNYQRLREKSQAFELLKDFLQLHKQYYRQRLQFILSNPHAAHWYYMQPKELSENWVELKQLDVSNHNYYPSFGLTQEHLAKCIAQVQKSLEQQEKKKEKEKNAFSTNIILTDTHNSPSDDDVSDSEAELNGFIHDSGGNDLADYDPNPFMSDEEDSNNFGIEISRSKRNRSQNSSPLFGSPYGYFTKKTKITDKESTEVTKLTDNNNQQKPVDDDVNENPKLVDDKLIEESSKILNIINKIENDYKNQQYFNYLKRAFNTIRSSQEISSGDSLLLLDLPTYLKIKQQQPIPQLTHSLNEFTQLHYNEVLYKTNIELLKMLMGVFVELLRKNSTESTPSQGTVIELLNTSFESLHNNTVLTKDICDKIIHFDLEILTQVKNSSQFSDKYQEIMEFILCAKMVASKTNLQTSAYSIINLIKTDNSFELLSLKKDFEELSDVPLEKVNVITLANLLKTEWEHIKGLDIKLIKELDYFWKIYKSDIETMYSELTNELQFAFSS